MNGTAVFEGRPVNGVIAHLLLGSATGFLAALFLCLTAFYSNPLPPGIMFSILAAVFLTTAARRLRIRQVVVDGSSISYYSGGALRWSIPWIEVRSVGNRRDNWGASTACLFLRTDGVELCLKDGTDFGPRKKLLALFVHLASCARERSVSVHDQESWLAESRHPPRSFEDRLTGTWQLELPEGLRTAEYGNRWLDCDDILKPVHIIVFLPAIAAPMAIVAWLLYSPGLVSGLFSWIIVLVPTMFLGAILVLIYKLAFVKVFFDGERITLRRNSGRLIEIPWRRVSRCRYDTDLKRLEIFSDIGNYVVSLDINSTLAICKRYSEATGRQAHVYYSNLSRASDTIII